MMERSIKTILREWYSELKAREGITQEELANRFGTSRTWVEMGLMEHNRRLFRLEDCRKLGAWVGATQEQLDEMEEAWTLWRLGYAHDSDLHQAWLEAARDLGKQKRRALIGRLRDIIAARS